MRKKSVLFYMYHKSQTMFIGSKDQSIFYKTGNLYDLPRNMWYTVYTNVHVCTFTAFNFYLLYFLKNQIELEGGGRVMVNWIIDSIYKTCMFIYRNRYHEKDYVIGLIFENWFFFLTRLRVFVTETNWWDCQIYTGNL